MKKNSPAKLNVFLKITGKRGAYHEIISRFIRHDKLYDEMEFISSKSKNEFELIGEFGCDINDNTITKAYYALKESGFSRQMDDFFGSHSVKVNKKIPEFAGLGGGSSNGATFLLLCNEVLNLGISKDDLASIGVKIGADLPFFIYEYESANISGIGEVVEELEERLPEIELHLPNIKSSTPKVYNCFRENFNGKFDAKKNWLDCSSESLLKTYDAKVLNDLFSPAIEIYPALELFHQRGYFMSGSGSSMFKVKNG